MASPATLFVFLLGVPAVLILPERYTLLALSCCIIASFSLTWMGLVTDRVPEPYLDEVFHIPQAQAYCNAEFNVWDPKLTTPPGLYLVSTAVLSLFDCTIEALRAVNALTLTLLVIPLLFCRSLIYRAKEQNWDTAHVAINICLFPPLFFFSGLYYTDVLSTLLVVLTYSYVLCGGSSIGKGLGTFVLGIAALGMRQTNIFWVAIYLAGIEWVRTCKSGTSWAKQERDGKSLMTSEWGGMVEEWSHGLLHDPKVEDANISDYFLCTISIGVAAVLSPIVLLTRIWPYIALLVSFAGFVFWNGGVVLGDKTNHVATIHAPQMLYLWPFITFFSLPVVLPFALDILASFVPESLGKNLGLTGSSSRTGKTLFSSILFGAVIVFVALIVVHFNTIIHPFTLADNRHYMFYAFRYTILRHPSAKYALTPIYVIGGWLVVRALGATFSKKSYGGQTPTSNLGHSSTATPEDRKKVVKDEQPSENISFVIIWFVSIALSLVTAPLVEPRYFIIPWVMWRLHVPSITSTSIVPTANSLPPPEFPLTTSNGSGKSSLVAGPTGRAANEQDGREVVAHNYTLYLETLWFVAINLITGYMFLYRTFEWKQEPGKIQRFMW